MRVVIVNDTAKRRNEPGRVGHFGCSLVMDTFEQYLGERGVEIVDTYALRDKPDWKVREGIDLAIINGEGTTHHGNGMSMIGWAVEHYPSVLINAVWQENPEYEFLKKLKYVAMRESLSAAAYPGEAEVVPDIIYGSDMLMNWIDVPPTKDIGYGDGVTTNGRGRISSIQKPEDYLTELEQYKRVCTGRHHGVIACAMMSIPFSAYPSNTHKIEGSMKDIGIPQQYYATEEEARMNVPQEFDDKIDEYIYDAGWKINQMFEKILSFS